MESTVAGTTNVPPSTREGVKEEISPPDSKVSFSEILRLVQTGQDIPGLQKLNIVATNERPTPSQMAPKPKPWEKKS